MTSLRHTVADLMVQIHKIAPELAEQHAREMEPSEVKRRFLFYVRPRLPGAELSAVSPLFQSGPRSSAQVCDPRRNTAEARHSAPLPETRESMPDSEIKNLGNVGSERNFAFGERLDHPEGVGFAVASRV
jgi:hypothetical protein